MRDTLNYQWAISNQNRYIYSYENSSSNSTTEDTEEKAEDTKEG